MGSAGELVVRVTASETFIVHGYVDGRACVARWKEGRLVADPEVVKRAEAIVAMGDFFVADEDPTHVVMASLEGGGYDVMLTVVRAFSQVTSVELPRV